MKQRLDADPAPALSRGLRLLELLGVEGQQSLEQLARKTGWPKSSVLRYLNALSLAGAAAQDNASLKWKALKRLQPLVLEHDSIMGRARRSLSALAEASGQCVELYDTGSGQAVLVDRAEPEQVEVAVLARIGFVRDLSELEAIAALCFAFDAERLPRRALWRWEKGEMRPVAAKTRDAVIARARRQTLSRDHDFNSNGIRRMALPLMESGKLRGVVAVAQRQTPRAKAEAVAIEQVLKTFNT